VEVTAENQEGMNLIALFMVAALRERVDRLERAGLSGDIALTVDRMSATLSCTEDRIVVRNGVSGNPRAHVRGTLEGFVALARGNLAGPMVRRHVRISGNPLATLPLAQVFRGGS
jgi:hypothetical protein